MFLISFDIPEIIQSLPNAALVQTKSVFNFQFSSFHITGIIGIDHNALVAKFLTPWTIPDFHNFELSTAAHTRNQVTAIQRTEIINFQNHIDNPQISNSTNQPKISFFAIAILLKFNPEIIVTKTVDILIAKQTIAGDKIIGIKFFKLKYSKNFDHLNTFSQSSSNAENNTIKGDNTTATQSIQILIINIKATAINGIPIAKTCQNDKTALNNAENVHASGGITHLHEFNKEEYSAVNTPT